MNKINSKYMVNYQICEFHAKNGSFDIVTSAYLSVL